MNKKISKPFYITTTLPYVNADPHIGFGMEVIRADVVARLRRATGYDVFFNTGTDEHGSKLYEAALKENLSPQAYVNRGSKRFQEFLKLVNISHDNFIRTTDANHILAAQKMWTICSENGDIYKARQILKYCVGCEMEKTDSDLVDDKCADHPNRELEIREEENYFFKFSKYQDQLLELYANNLVTPESKQNEIRNFVQSGLHDFSISRLKSKMPWGVDVPDDSEHVMYVWFDALTSYIATLGWGTDISSNAGTENNFNKYWIQNTAEKEMGEDNVHSINELIKESEQQKIQQERQVVQYCGKDNNKAQSAIWQAMLLSAKIPNTTNIIINGHIISGGIKMSKSIGNIISPFDIYEKYKEVALYPEDVIRFVLTHEVSNFEDSDITTASIDEAYKNYLQNGIGNQLNRILKLSSQYLNDEDIKNIIAESEKEELEKNFVNYIYEYKLNDAIKTQTHKVKLLDEYIQKNEPFKLVKSVETLEHGKEIIKNSLIQLLSISHHMYFYMPNTSMFIYEQIKKNVMPEKVLFGRLV